MRSTTEKLQHRRHRPVYLAPRAAHLQNYSTKSYDSGEYFDSENYVNDNFIEDLRIPLFVEIPQDHSLRMPVTSPPCSNDSEASTLLSSLLHRTQHQPVESQPNEVYFQSASLRSLRERLYELISSAYTIISDFILLILVCITGLFFHVEVQVVKQRVHGRKGRVIVRQSSRRETRQPQYKSTDLLRPLQQGSSYCSVAMADDIV